MHRFLFLFGLCVLISAWLRAEEPTTVDTKQLRAEVERLLGDLDSDRFDVRRDAARRLDALAAKPELGPLLAAEFHRVSVCPDISFEVRWHLNRWIRQLPEPPLEPAVAASPEELDRLMLELDDDSYALRSGAAERIGWLSSNPKLVGPLMLRLKRRMAEPALSGESRAQIEKLWQRVRGTWLLDDSIEVDWPDVSDAEIDRWLDDFSGPPAGDALGMQAAAHCELLDLLARDAYIERLTAAIRARLEQKPDADVAARLNSLLGLTKPAMVAEYWSGRRHLGVQHILVGVPTLAPGAARPTLFDHCDDRTAHYVSGNSLMPGDYPVGVAFPHPKQEEAFFRLVNLPTPRRRMAYDCYLNVEESKRLAEISRRTLDNILVEKRPMSEPELVMLAQLDPAEVSRFAGKYFLAVEDSYLPRVGLHRLGGRPSRFGLICVQLALEGSKEAMPGLADAMAKDVFLSPTLLAPYRLDALAALSIAARDPWPEVDAWLAARITDRNALVEGQPDAAELGATAAALLLSRHGQAAEEFDLHPSDEAMLSKVSVDGYRYADGADGRKIQQWWEKTKQQGQRP